MRMIRHIVMWKLRGDSPGERERHAHAVKASLESLRGKVPGLLALQIGVDTSRDEAAFDVVMVSDFASHVALHHYADHPEHLRVKREIGSLRVARHQVDYELPPPKEMACPAPRSFAIRSRTASSRRPTPCWR
jgi:hypothetical protein